LPVGETSKHVIQSADIKSLSALVKHTQSLQAVVDRQQLDVSPQALADRIDVKTPVGSQTLIISLQWRGPGNAETLLNGVMDEFITRADEIRRRKMDERAADFNIALLACERDLQTRREQLITCYRQNDVLDLPRELRAATADSELLATSLSQARRNETNCRAQLTELDSTIDHLIHQSAGTGARRQTPERVQQRIDEERQREENQVQLDIKNRERTRIQQMFAINAASKAELDRIDGTIATLQSKVQDNKKIQEWKQEIVELERTAGAPSLLQQAFLKKLDLALQLLVYPNELLVLTADHNAKQRQLERLLKLQTQAAPLVSQIERAETERNRLQTHLDQLRVLRAMSGGEATVYQPAAAVIKPFGAARSWLIPVAVGCCALLLWLGVFVALHSYGAVKTSASLATEMGLPILATIPSEMQNPAHSLGVRSLALSLRQRLPEAGTTILFVPVQGGTRSRELLMQTATTLAQRDERVLILETVLPAPADRKCRSTCAETTARCHCDQVPFGFGAEGTQTGLSNYLAFEISDPNEVVQPTPVFGVDHLPAGTAAITQDTLATHRMRELLEQLRQSYTIILVAGPPVAADTDVQLLAAHQDGVVVLLDGPSPVPASTQQLFRTYRRIGLPLIGWVEFAA
jgi:hypothetical protein